MNTQDQNKMLEMFKAIDLQKKYKKMYGEDWSRVYKEDKENGCLINVD